MAYYNKLVRDKVPGTLRAGGRRVVTRTIVDKELMAALRAKMDEELGEFDAAATDDLAAAELADLLEVVVALAKARGCSETKLNELRAQKAEARGAFDRALLLVEVE